MKILHTSDWHLGRSLEYISRIDEQREFIDELCGIVEREEIDIVLVAGDIFDTYNPSTAAEELFFDAMDRLNGKGKRAVIVVAGNHDSPERLCAANPLAYKNGIIILGYPTSDAGKHQVTNTNIKVVQSGAGWLELSLKGCEHNAIIVTLPYPSESRLENALVKDLEEEKLQQAYSEKVGRLFAELTKNFRDDTVNLAVSHLFVMGGKESESERPLQVGGALTVAPQMLPANAHFIGLGHLHRPQRIKNAPSPAYYAGSPLAYSFSEAGYSKAVYLIEAFPGKEAEIREVYLTSGKPLCNWAAKNGIEEVLKWCEEGKDSNAWVDLEIYTDKPLTLAEQKQIRELHPGVINIRPVIKLQAEEIIPAEKREGKRLDALFGDYYRYKTGMEISEEILGTFLDVANSLQELDDEEEVQGGEDFATKIS